MGRFIGSFMDDQELDRPDLNKCPDCGCYFAQDNCPLCGKECPEEMRAGNRKPAKKKKYKNGRSKAVEFVDWYYKWWFIILMLIVFPIIGFVLLINSPHKRSLKITAAVIAIIYAVVSYFGIGEIIGSVKMRLEKPVDESLSYEEYVGKCRDISVEDYYRRPDDYKGDFVKASLVVAKAFSSDDSFFSAAKYTEYYVCKFVGSNGQTYEILVRNCAQAGIKNLKSGDKIVVYGECAGMVEVTDTKDYARKGPCINGAYFELAE